MPRRNQVSLANAFTELRADFRASKDTRFQSRLTGVSSAGSGADYHYRSERQFLHMMERARNYQRNDPIVGQGVRRLVANIVQDGFRLDVNTGDDGLNTELKARWDEWSTDADQCHSEGEFDFCQMEAMTLSQMVVDGDIFSLLLKMGSVQMVEAHRVRTPRNTKKNVVHGILLDKLARRREYWVTKEDLDPNRALSRVSDIERYPARDPKTGDRLVLHYYDPYRFSQRRGVTAIAPVSEITGMFDDVQFATLVKAQMAALVAVFHERDATWEAGSDQQKGSRETETIEGGTTRTIEGISAGLEIFGDVGEKLSMDSPNIPSPEFFPHSMLLLTFIAINLDLPVAVLLLDPSNTNFSGWRGAIDQARLRFKQMQTRLLSKWHRPIYRWKVRQWMAQDSVIRSVMAKSDIKIFGHRWNPPTFPYIEPLKDASADLLQQRNAMNSPRRLQAARGRQWPEIVGEIVDDNSLAILKAIERANEINKKHPDAGVHWREIISLPTPDGVTVSVNGNAPDQSEPETKNRNKGAANRLAAVGVN